MNRFEIVSDYVPTGDQPSAIEALARGLRDGLRDQVLLGVTGSGKTFTIANLVAREQRPTTRSLARWAEDLTGQPDKIEQAGRILASLADQDLEAWGFSRAEIEGQLHAVDPSASRPGGRRPRFTRYALERRLLIVLRRNIHHNAFGRLIQRVRDLCNVLLR